MEKQAVGLLDAKNIYHAEKKGNRLPRPERPALPLTMGSWEAPSSDYRRICGKLGLLVLRWPAVRALWEEPSSLARPARPRRNPLPYEGEEDVKSFRKRAGHDRAGHQGRPSFFTVGTSHFIPTGIAGP